MKNYQLPIYITNNIVKMDSGILDGIKKVYRLTMDRMLTEKEIQELKQNKKVVKISTCSLACAPEIKHSVVYIERK